MNRQKRLHDKLQKALTNYYRTTLQHRSKNLISPIIDTRIKFIIETPSFIETTLQIVCPKRPNQNRREQIDDAIQQHRQPEEKRQLWYGKRFRLHTLGQPATAELE